jgi:hypothetical protein
MLTHLQSSVGDVWSDFANSDGSPLPNKAYVRIRCYEANAKSQQKKFYTSEIAVILASAAIPLAVAMGAPRSVSALLGALVVVATGLRHLFKWGENWIRSSRTLLDIQAEVAKWSAGQPPYKGSDASTKLVAQIDTMVYKDASSWLRMLPSAHGQTNLSTSGSS